MTKETYKQIRLSLKLTQKELAERFGVSKTTIYRREKGISPITKRAEKEILTLKGN